MGSANLKMSYLLVFLIVAVEKVTKPTFKGTNQKAVTMKDTTQTQILVKKVVKPKENLVSLSINPLEKIPPVKDNGIQEVTIKNAEYVFLKRLLIYTEGYYAKAYKDGRFLEKTKKGKVWKQNWSVGYGSNAGIGEIRIPSVKNKAEGWKLAESQLSNCMQKAKTDFPLLRKHQHYAVASLYYKAGIHIFELSKDDPKYAASMKIRRYLKRGELPTKSVLTPLWISLKNNVGNHRETRLLEISLLYRDEDNRSFQTNLVKLINETK